MANLVRIAGENLSNLTAKKYSISLMTVKLNVSITSHMNKLLFMNSYRPTDCFDVDVFRFLSGYDLKLKVIKLSDITQI